MAHKTYCYIKQRSFILFLKFFLFYSFFTNIEMPFNVFFAVINNNAIYSFYIRNNWVWILCSIYFLWYFFWVFCCDSFVYLLNVWQNNENKIKLKYISRWMVICYWWRITCYCLILNLLVFYFFLKFHFAKKYSNNIKIM